MHWQSSAKSLRKPCPVAFAIKKTANGNRTNGRTQSPGAAGAAFGSSWLGGSRRRMQFSSRFRKQFSAKRRMQFSAEVVCTFRQKLYALSAKSVGHSSGRRTCFVLKFNTKMVAYTILNTQKLRKVCGTFDESCITFLKKVDYGI